MIPTPRIRPIRPVRREMAESNEPSFYFYDILPQQLFFFTIFLFTLTFIIVFLVFMCYVYATYQMLIMFFRLDSQDHSRRNEFWPSVN